MVKRLKYRYTRQLTDKNIIIMLGILDCKDYLFVNRISTVSSKMAIVEASKLQRN